jgi:hypothetical protein
MTTLIAISITIIAATWAARLLARFLAEDGYGHTTPPRHVH